MMRKLMILAALLVCLLTLATGSAMASYEPGEGTVVVQPSQSYDSNIEERADAANLDLQRIENALFEGLYQCQETIDISALDIPYKKSNVDLISSLIHDEMPECFHVNGFSYGYSGGKIVRIMPTYTMEKAQYQQMYAQIQAAADRLLEGIAGNAKLDDVQKALLVHDRLALFCEYDYHSGANRHNIYGALVVGSAVCQGYAEAYDFLLEKVGIDGYICESTALNHAWNIIYINKKAYHVDVTWDDYSWATGERGAVGAVKHENFLRSSAGIYSTKHTANDYDTSPKDTTYDDYFWQTSNAAFLMVGDEIYYIDGAANQLKRYSNHEALCTVKSRWGAENGYYWVGNFARLATDGKDLFYSLADAVYKYDLATGEQTEIFTPDLEEGFEIYGFVYEEGYLVCDINAGPPFSTVNDLYQIKQSYQTGPAMDPNLKFAMAPGLSFQDYIGVQIFFKNSTGKNYDRVYAIAVQKDPTEGNIETECGSFAYGSTYTVFEHKVMAWSMAESVTITLYGEKDGKVYQGQVIETSVEALALAKIADYASKNNAQACTALVDMLNYGAAVQISEKHNADKVPSAGEYAQYATATNPAFDATNVITGSGVKVYANSVSMQAKVEIQLMFKTADMNGKTFKATVNGTEAAVEYTPYSTYTICRVAVGASQMRDTFTIALYDADGNAVSAVYEVSVEAYGQAQLSGTKADVVNAMMKYGDAVAAIA